MTETAAKEKFKEFLMPMDEQIDWVESEVSSCDTHIDLSDDFGTIQSLA